MLPNYTIRRQLVKKHMVKRYVDGNGKQRVCGGVDLKTSQAYPKQFLGHVQQSLSCCYLVDHFFLCNLTFIPNIFTVISD